MDLLPYEIDQFIGRKYGRLTVIGYLREEYQSSYRKIYHQYFYSCRCDCGNPKTARLGDLLSGRVKSCGCLRKSVMTQYGKSSFIHGGHGTRLYNIWSEMKSRCLNVNSPAYVRYGARGIRICDEWLNFIPFRDWSLENSYRDDLSIDRIDNDGNYCPENCHWITMEEQAKNKRNNVYISYIRDFSDIGEDPVIYTFTMGDWARILNVDKRRLSERIRGRRDRSINEIIESFIPDDHLGFVLPDNVTLFPDRFEISLHD